MSDNMKIYASQDWVKENAIPTPTTASVGQVLVVKAVDENGVPTEWEFVTLNFTVDEDGVLST